MNLDRAYTLCAHNQSQQALVEMLESLDTAARAGQFEIIDELLEKTQEHKLTHAVLLGMLTMTMPAREHLSEWYAFWQRVDQQFEATLGRLRTRELLRRFGCRVHGDINLDEQGYCKECLWLKDYDYINDKHPNDKYRKDGTKI